METITSAPGHERVARYRDFVPSHAMRFYARICHLFIVHLFIGSFSLLAPFAHLRYNPAQ